MPASLDDILSTQKNAVIALNAISSKLGTLFPQWQAVPANATASGIAGQVAYASGFLYVCVATNTWQRTALSTF